MRQSSHNPIPRELKLDVEDIVGRIRPRASVNLDGYLEQMSQIGNQGHPMLKGREKE